MADAPLGLSDAVLAFYRKLPQADYPKALIDGYPRIATQIVTLNTNKTALAAYFQSLLSDDRGGRQGFPFPVLVNIQNLFDVMIGIPDGFADTDRLFLPTGKR